MWFPGFLGILVALTVFPAIWLIVFFQTQGESFNFEVERGEFEKLLVVYLDIAKFILTLAGGGIVLIISSTALASTKRLPAAYASPLFLLAMSIVYGILFMPFLALDYEGFRNRQNPYRRSSYVRNQTLGFSTLTCFCVGYAWLIVAAVKG